MAGFDLPSDDIDHPMRVAVVDIIVCDEFYRKLTERLLLCDIGSSFALERTPRAQSVARWFGCELWIRSVQRTSE